METYEQKIERMAMFLFVAMVPESRTEGMWTTPHSISDVTKNRYRDIAKRLLEEEARDIENEEEEWVIQT